MSILFLLESPGKIAKISSMLGKNYIVKASVGHFRDLDAKKMSIDFDNNFEPIYVITKPDVVKNLKTAMKGVDLVYLAADEDREGEAIAQSLYDVLKPKNYKRLRFNAITKEAIMAAIKNAGDIDERLVDAQKARRVLDRLFGYLISPILQRQIGGKLSAGRVQSVALRIIVDKETDIKNFINKNSDSSYFRVTGIFGEMKAILFESSDKKPHDLEKAFNGKTAQIALSEGDNPNIKVIAVMKKFLKSNFVVHSVDDRISTRSPSPPFITSTLQQEANRKFGMSIDSTMKTAQKLYEAGLITYMRTDSVEISDEGHAEIKKIIESEYGKDYYQRNQYKNKAVNSQEAHEAIRPTHPELMSAENDTDDAYQIKLYKLIWQRTIASQMKPARIKVTTIQISASKYIEEKIIPFYYFQSQIESIVFPGFMRVYVESIDDTNNGENGADEITTKNFSGKIPTVGSKIIMQQIVARQEFLKPPPRFSEASLVKKLEELGIGRPSTYVNTIKTILNRDYIKIGDVAGIKKDITIFTIKSENKKHIMEVFEDNDTVLLGRETKKIIPTSLGITVNNFLMENFASFLDYKFTANMETDLDYVSTGTKDWYKVVQDFYDKLNPVVEELSKKKGITQSSDRLLGVDENGEEIYATRTKYGPVVRKKSGDKFVYAKIKEPLTVENIKLKDALKLLVYPKNLGKYKKLDVFLQRGEYGFYLIYDKENYSVGEISESEIDLDKAIEIIEARKANNIAEFTVMENDKKVKTVVLNGKFGYYVQATRGKLKKNYPVPKNLDPKNLTEKDVLDIISTKKTYSKKGGAKTAKKPVKKTLTKKTPVKKTVKKAVKKTPLKKTIGKVPMKKN
ncbi:topoisomerase I [Cotonvirus japonicus]|uniref:DNA topoisomerase n=1 Tax=Cotonvirus japonicus TaxID=2811091 RepID=A0ABM7NS30_9VIRU|nr:topoisomerase I [Cotonvirus japonicus]BCS82968.1 topoisomerase I [Cotonvirus japonicus]